MVSGRLLWKKIGMKRKKWLFLAVSTGVSFGNLRYLILDKAEMDLISREGGYFMVGVEKKRDIGKISDVLDNVSLI